MWLTKMIYFVGVINIILMLILMKNSYSASRNLTKRTKLRQVFKKSNQIKTKRIREPT